MTQQELEDARYEAHRLDVGDLPHAAALIRKMADELERRLTIRSALAGICQSEGPRGAVMCMLPLGHVGKCGWEA